MLERTAAPPAELLARFADDVFPVEVRSAALQRFGHTHSGRERPGRYWHIDLDAVSIDDLAFDPACGDVTVVCDDPRVRVGEPPQTLGMTASGASKFGALASAFANRYAFVTIPPDADVERPIVITYRAGTAPLFPYTCVHVRRGARATIVQRIEGDGGAFVCGIVEVVTEDGSDLRVATVQDLPQDARLFLTIGALPGRDSAFSCATADLGAALVVEEIGVELLAMGAQAQIASIFFPRGNQHVDLRSTVDHRVGGATSLTTVKSAATDRGQGRYVGNIRIAARAQKSDASLRDDALLLSPSAHIDSVPALEIAANDVKAYHGATVGALDAEMLFYMMTRGIERDAAERMVTLGFFEPALERFPEQLRDELRGLLAAKIA
ncbi:MAG: Fe-S cluster assembly protein SufD [Candidatus Tyrphobacter sp.]